jgi:hypothetical protein
VLGSGAQHGVSSACCHSGHIRDGSEDQDEQ